MIRFQAVMGFDVAVMIANAEISVKKWNKKLSLSFQSKKWNKKTQFIISKFILLIWRTFFGFFGFFFRTSWLSISGDTPGVTIILRKKSSTFYFSTKNSSFFSFFEGFPVHLAFGEKIVNYDYDNWMNVTEAFEFSGLNLKIFSLICLFRIVKKGMRIWCFPSLCFAIALFKPSMMKEYWKWIFEIIEIVRCHSKSLPEAFPYTTCIRPKIEIAIKEDE